MSGGGWRYFGLSTLKLVKVVGMLDASAASSPWTTNSQGTSKTKRNLQVQQWVDLPALYCEELTDSVLIPVICERRRHRELQAWGFFARGIIETIFSCDVFEYNDIAPNYRVRRSPLVEWSHSWLYAQIKLDDQAVCVCYCKQRWCVLAVVYTVGKQRHVQLMVWVLWNNNKK